MLDKSLPNKEIDLSFENDLLGHLNKANAITSFLKLNTAHLSDYKMFALYGEWGSGKSTMMKYIQKKLEAGEFKTIFFEAWQHEKDHNLPLSLVDAIADSVEGSDISNEDLKLIASRFFKAIGKGISIDLGAFKVEGKEIITSAEKDIEKDFDKASERLKLQTFKDEFSKVEKLAIKGKKKIIVFIDDLDRCEPENVLHLLSSLKLFFTYGTDVIFLTGVDKAAISKAIKTKYGTIIKSEEYLEKIFDVSFSMPKSHSIQKLIRHYFPNDNKRIAIRLEEFFKQINFTNPRHLKKVMNKYLLIQAFVKTEETGNSFLPIVPELFYNSDASLLEIVFTLFFIVLHEFYPDKFSELEAYEEKIIHYGRIHHTTFNRENNRGSGTAEILKLSLSISQVQNVPHGVFISEYKSLSITKLMALCTTPAPNTGNLRNYFKLLSIFCPKEVESFKMTEIENSDFVKQFAKKKRDILVDFCKYLVENKEEVLNMKSDYKFWNFFEMANTLL
jgi:hypothetical protein